MLKDQSEERQGVLSTAIWKGETEDELAESEKEQEKDQSPTATAFRTKGIWRGEKDKHA